jgi:type VI secretion system protein ImpB
MPESLQHKLDRVRRPRVHITYDVHTGGAMKRVELPFVIGVLADLSGQPKASLRPLKDRKAVFIDRDNFNEVLTKVGARLALRVPNRLTDPNSKLAVELNFKHIDDFEPARVAEQIAPLKQLLDMRQELTQLLARMEGNDKLSELLESILTNQEKAKALGQYLDIQSPTAPEAAPAPPAPKKAAPAPAKKAPVAPPPEPAEVEEAELPEELAEETTAEETPPAEVAEETPPADVAEESPLPEVAEETPAAPEPAEEAAVDPDLEALLASLGTDTEPPADEPPAKT